MSYKFMWNILICENSSPLFIYLKEAIDEALKVAYILLRWVLLSIPYRSKFILKDLTPWHNRLLIKTLLIDHIAALTPAQFVFSMFLTGLSREYPMLNYSACPSRGFSLPRSLNSKFGRIHFKLKSPLNCLILKIHIKTIFKEGKDLLC